MKVECLNAFKIMVFGLVKRLSRWRHPLPAWRPWVWVPRPTEWKGRTIFHKLSSEHYVCHAPPPNKYICLKRIITLMTLYSLCDTALSYDIFFFLLEKGVVFGSPLTEEGIAQIYQLIEYLHKSKTTQSFNSLCLRKNCQFSFESWLMG